MQKDEIATNFLLSARLLSVAAAVCVVIALRA